MRKYLIASLSACLVSACFVGCGQKSQEVVVSEQLESLLDQMSRLQYADAPSTKDRPYSDGAEVNGVMVPGSTRFEASYLDKALALLPQAEAIKQNGTPIQIESANAIIGSIRIDEASFLIDEAERSFQASTREVVALRNKLDVIREIEALKRTVAGDRTQVIETYQTGLRAGTANIIGIDGLKEQATAAGAEASSAGADLARHSEEISKLREQVVEYEALELKLTGEARSSQSTIKYDKLDQATAAAKEAETAEMLAQKTEIDAWISQRVSTLAEFKRQQLAGDEQGSTDGLLAKLDGFLADASQSTNTPSGNDAYDGLAALLAEAKAAPGNDATKAASFLLDMSEYSTQAAPNSDVRQTLVMAMDQLVNGYLGIIGTLEMKIAQISLERQRVSDRLAEIDQDRAAVLAEFEADFAEHDAMIRAAGFDRMAAALESLKIAEEAVVGSGKGTDMELMNVYMLRARALQQQSVSAQLYSTMLSSIVSAGPELLGTDLHTAISSRALEMQNLLAEVKAAADDLQISVSTPAAALAGLDPETTRGAIAARQMEVYDGIMASLGAAPAGIPDESPSIDDTPIPEAADTDLPAN
ncbi:MAG: hypothetical protein AAGI37_16710 [Planctomycetota bacterium]